MNQDSEETLELSVLSAVVYQDNNLSVYEHMSRTERLVYKHTMESYPHLRRKDILLYVATFKNFELLKLSQMQNTNIA